MKPAPLRAEGRGWRSIGERRVPGGVCEAFVHDSGIFCLSAVDVVEKDFHGSGIEAPHYHVSATFRLLVTPRACSDQEMEMVRAAFGLAGAEEDNHGEGIARHLWIACDRDREPRCPCKQDEQAIVEGSRVRHDEAPASGGGS